MKKPCKNHVVDGAVDGAAMAASVAAPASVRHGAETCKNHVVDGAVDGAAMAASVAAPASVRQPNLSKNQPPKNCLTSPSDAHKKDEERPTPMPDITRQAASKAWKNRAKTM